MLKKIWFIQETDDLLERFIVRIKQLFIFFKLNLWISGFLPKTFFVSLCFCSAIPFACSHCSAVLISKMMPENTPCSILEALKSLRCDSLLVSISLPVPCVLNIRLTAKQHNVVELTGSQHNLATVCSYPYGQFVFRSHTNEHTHTSFILYPSLETALPSYLFLYPFPFFLFSPLSLFLVNSLPPFLFSYSFFSCSFPWHPIHLCPAR